MSFDSHAEENSLPADYGTLQWWKKEEQPGDPSWTRVKGQAVISTVLPWPNSLGIVSGSHWGPEACSAQRKRLTPGGSRESAQGL